jgi:DNA polymerase III delta subunit
MASAGAKNFTLSQLQQGMNDCLDADKALVTSGQDSRMVLHKLVIRLCDGKRAA